MPTKQNSEFFGLVHIKKNFRKQNLTHSAVCDFRILYLVKEVKLRLDTLKFNNSKIYKTPSEHYNINNIIEKELYTLATVESLILLIQACVRKQNSHMNFKYTSSRYLNESKSSSF